MGLWHNFISRTQQETRPSSARLDLFRLKKPRPLARPSSRRSFNRPLFAVVFAAVFVLTLVALSHATPPLSRGARPIALGGGYTAVSGDGYSLFYNPAGLFDLNQQEVAIDYGRWHSEGAPAGSDFNGIYAMPWRYKDQRVPVAFGVYGEGSAPGAHIVDITAGGAFDAPVERWTRGLFKFPVRAGLAATIRHSDGDDKSDRVGKSTFGLGLTGGLLIPINRQHQAGVALRGLFAGGANPEGPSLNLGIMRQHRDYLDMYLDMQVSEGNVWRFHPGMEWSLARGVLRPRLGWGFRGSKGVDSVATGVGFYLSPYEIDITYLIPVRSLNDNAGQVRASLIYRFGRPQFSEIYYDRALEAAGTLDVNVLQLTVKEAELKSSLAEVEQKRRLASEELQSMKKRIELLQGQDILGERDATIRQLRARLRQLEAELGQRRSRDAATRKKAEPRSHVVQPGDTLQSIARKYYGDPNQWKKIYGANMDRIERGLPKQGSRLVIP